MRPLPLSCSSVREGSRLRRLMKGPADAFRFPELAAAALVRRRSKAAERPAESFPKTINSGASGSAHFRNNRARFRSGNGTEHMLFWRHVVGVSLTQVCYVRMRSCLGHSWPRRRGIAANANVRSAHPSFIGFVDSGG